MSITSSVNPRRDRPPCPAHFANGRARHLLSAGKESRAPGRLKPDPGAAPRPLAALLRPALEQPSQLLFVVGRIDEIGKMAGGWSKQIQASSGR